MRATFHKHNSNKLMNSEIVKVFSKYIQYHDGALLGITGDIDDLGIYVATSGRALAENLVDIYNQYLRQYFYEWESDNSKALIDVCFIQSGEESLLLGACKHIKPVELFFDNIYYDINGIIKNNSYISPAKTTISFGSAFINNPSLDQKIEILINKILHDISFDPIPYICRLWRKLGISWS